MNLKEHKMKIQVFKDPYSKNFIAYSKDLGLYGYGETPDDAKDNLIAIIRE